MPINIDITTSPDLDFLARVHAASFDKAWDRKSLGEMFSITGTTAFSAHGKGFGILRTIGQEAEILTIAVLPEFRKQGVGMAIARAMHYWARSQQVSSLFLEVREGNFAARELYWKSGFIVLSRRKGYYANTDGTTEDAVVMRQEITFH